MKTTDEKTAQQQRLRGFWAGLKNPRTIKVLIGCGKFIYRAYQLYSKLTGEGGGLDD